MNIKANAVQRLSVAYFDRPAEPEVLKFWQGKLGHHTSATPARLEKISVGFSDAAEYKILHAGQSNSQIIDSLYQNLFGHVASPSDMGYWIDKLQAGSETVASLPLSVSYRATGHDATVLENKLLAAKAFTTALNTYAEIASYHGPAAKASAQNWLNTITDSRPTKAAVNAAIISMQEAAEIDATSTAAAEAAGPVLIATATTTDSLSGTVGKDTFVGTYNDAGTGTWNTTDVLNGGAGIDTLNIIPIGVSAITPADAYWSNITNIEKIVINTTGAGAQTITTGANFNTAFAASGVALTTTSGAGAINIDMSTFTGAATLTTTSSDGAQTIVTGSGVTTVTATNLTAGAQTISGAGLATVTATAGAAGAQTISGGANLVTVIATAGAGAQTITSTSTSAVTVTATSGAGATTIVTGAGNDTITLLATDAAGANVITGNAGADTITLVTGALAASDTIVIGNADSGISVATADKVTGFATAVDFLQMGTAGVIGATGTYVEAGAAVANFAAALTAANAALATLAGTSAAAELYSFQFDTTNGYLFNDIDGNGTADQVVVLVGIDNTEISAADIMA